MFIDPDAISLICVWDEILLGSQGTNSQPDNILFKLSKKLVQHIGEVLSCKNRNETFNLYAPELEPIFYSAIKHGKEIWKVSKLQNSNSNNILFHLSHDNDTTEYKYIHSLMV